MNKIVFTLLFTLLLSAVNISAQEKVTIGMLGDGQDMSLYEFTGVIKQEINSLLENNFDVSFIDAHGNFDPEQIATMFQEFVQNDSITHIIATGPIGSIYAMLLEDYPKPVHAATIIDHVMASAPKTKSNTTGVHNLSYTEIDADPKKDLEIFSEIIEFQNLGIVIPGTTEFYNTIFKKYFDQLFDEIGNSYHFIPLVDFDANLETSKADAIYFTVFGDLTSEEIGDIIEKVNQKKLPSFALSGRDIVELGALASYTPSNNFQLRARRIGINILKSVEGHDPAEFPIQLSAIESDFVVNMLTAQQIDIYPNFKTLGDAELLNVHQEFTDNSYNLRKAILESLEENLGLRSASYNILYSDQDIKNAITEFLPNGDISLTGAAVDKKIHENPQAGTAPFNLTTDASVSQLIFSAPAIMNIVISKLTSELEGHLYKQDELDLIYETCQAYLNILLAESNVRIQNENVSVTRSNLNISKQKVDVGYTSESDKLRWESEFAFNKIDLAESVSQLKSARYFLNNYLNNEIDYPFRTEEVDITEDNLLMISDDSINMWLKDPASLYDFSDFLIEEAFRNLPELKQIESALNIQERSLKWQKANFVLPSIGGQAGLNYSFYNTGPSGDMLTYDRPYWNAGISASLPISTGGKNLIQKQTTQLNIEQLNLDRDNLEQFLELQIRINLENVAASYTRLLLSESAVTSSNQGLQIAQDNYTQGTTNITQLIDVQNSFLQAEQLAASAVYQFYLDFLSIERSIGFFYSLATEEEKRDFRQRVNKYMQPK